MVLPLNMSVLTQHCLDFWYPRRCFRAQHGQILHREEPYPCAGWFLNGALLSARLGKTKSAMYEALVSMQERVIL